MPAYFVSQERSANGGPVKGTFWRTRQDFGCIEVHINLHLLAYAVGDPFPTRLPVGSRPVDPQPYCLRYRRDAATDSYVCDFEIPELQPWAVRAGNEIQPLRIGPRLSDFLNDPLGTGERMNLALPFADQEVELTGGWARERGAGDDPDGAFHGGFDFRNDTRSPRVLFPVVAAADGVVKRARNGGVCLLHETARRAQYYTIYRHIETTSLTVAQGDTVRVGQMLGRVDRWPEDDGGDNSHLHFTVAVRVPGFTLGATNVPELWYAIDPFGVYDYHRDDGNALTYAPTRPGGFEQALRGRTHTLQFREDPLIRSLPGELHTDYRPITNLLVRTRTSTDSSAGGWPVEQDLAAVYLDGEDDIYRLPMQNLRDADAERQLIATLRTAQVEGKWVSLGYRWVNGRRIISAAWVRR